MAISDRKLISIIYRVRKDFCIWLNLFLFDCRAKMSMTFILCFLVLFSVAVSTSEAADELEETSNLKWPLINTSVSFKTKKINQYANLLLYISMGCRTPCPVSGSATRSRGMERCWTNRLSMCKFWIRLPNPMTGIGFSNQELWRFRLLNPMIAHSNRQSINKQILDRVAEPHDRN